MARKKGRKGSEMPASRKLKEEAERREAIAKENLWMSWPITDVVSSKGLLPHYRQLFLEVSDE